MKLKTLTLILLTLTTAGWAFRLSDTPGSGYWTGDYESFKAQCAAYDERTQKSNRYQIQESTSTWTVIKGSETFTLTQFVQEGRLCAVIGHRWVSEYVFNRYFGTSYEQKNFMCEEFCTSCKRGRKKYKSEYWEEELP